MKTKEELISYYEKQLEKVIKAYENDHRKEEYINYAKEQLEAVKNGRTW
jgi:phosphopantothenate synthetase